MSRFVATSAIRGAARMVGEAEEALQEALERLGPDAPVAFTNTAYFLPVSTHSPAARSRSSATCRRDRARQVAPAPDARREMWLPYLGETLDSGIATLFAEETLEGVRFAEGPEPQRIKLSGYQSGAERVGADASTFVHGDQALLNGPIDDIQLRTWGIQLVDGRMPGFCAIVGCAKSNEVAVKIVRELQSRGILIFLSGNVNGRSIIHQLMEEGVQLGYDTFTVPFGIDTIVGDLCPGLRGPLGAHLRRHGSRQGARHHALQQEPRVRLGAGARRGRRPEVRHGGRRHLLRLPRRGRHPHPADPADRRHHSTSTSSRCPSTRSPAPTTWSAPRSSFSAASRYAASR